MPFDQLAQQRRVGSSHVAQPALSCHRKLPLQFRLIDLFQHGLERHHRKIAPPRERAVVVVDESDAAAHSRCKIAPGSAENHHRAAGHVLAAMVSCSLDDRGRTGVAYAKTLAGDAAEVCFALDRTVHHGVADHDVVLRPRRRLGVGIHHDAAAGQSFADVIVSRALELESDAAGEEGAEALACRSVERNVQRVIRQALVTIAAGDNAGEHRAHRAIGVADAVLQAHRPALLDGELRLRDQLVIESAREPVVLRFAVISRDFRGHLRLVENPREV